MPCLNILIAGQVQGVSFRYFIAREARLLNIKGWVRNRQDRLVEVLAQGEESALQQLLRKCRIGPPLAAIERVEAKDEDVKEELKGFEIKY